MQKKQFELLQVCKGQYEQSLKYFQNFTALEKAQSDLSIQSNSLVEESKQIAEKLSEKIKAHPEKEELQ